MMKIICRQMICLSIRTARRGRLKELLTRQEEFSARWVTPKESAKMSAKIFQAIKINICLNRA